MKSTAGKYFVLVLFTILATGRGDEGSGQFKRILAKSLVVDAHEERVDD